MTVITQTWSTVADGGILADADDIKKAEDRNVLMLTAALRERGVDAERDGSFSHETVDIGTGVRVVTVWTVAGYQPDPNASTEIVPVSR